VGYPSASLASISDVIEQYKKNKIRFDYQAHIKKELTSFSLNPLSMVQEESASAMFMKGKNINLTQKTLESIVKNYLKNKNVEEGKIDKVISLIQNYQDKITHVMYQTFIKKEAIKNVVYVSKEFGAPVIENDKLLDRNQKLIDILNGGYEQAVSLKGIDSTIHQNVRAASSVGFGKLQVRAITNTDTFAKNSETFLHYYEEEKRELENLRNEMDHILGEPKNSLFKDANGL
jgi:hypothetical protein